MKTVLINFLLVCFKRCKLDTVTCGFFDLSFSVDVIIGSELVCGNLLNLTSSFNCCVPKWLAEFVARRQDGDSTCDYHVWRSRLVCYTSNEFTLKGGFIFDILLENLSVHVHSNKMENLIPQCLPLTVIVALATLFCNTGKGLSLILNALITEKLVIK